jgi:hypothetical protein
MKIVFVFRQLGGLLEDGIEDADLPDVVQQHRDPHSGEAALRDPQFPGQAHPPFR